MKVDLGMEYGPSWMSQSVILSKTPSLSVPMYYYDYG